MLEKIYMKSPVFLQNIAVSAYGALLAWRRVASPTHRRLLHEITEVETRDRAEVRAVQCRKLRDTLKHAAASVPYYREMFRGVNTAKLEREPINTLRSLPILEKQQVQKQPEKFLSENDKVSTIVFTSGSTGSPLAVRCNREARLRNYAHFYRLRQRLGIEYWDKCATFGGRTLARPERSEPPFWRYNVAANTVLYSTYHLKPGNIQAYLGKLEDQQPDLIDSYPSALGLVASALQNERNVSIAPRAIITSSETLLPHQRSTAEEAFGCKVYDYYGNAEMTAFIAECEQGNYHAWPTYGLSEILKDGRPVSPGEEGELVTTGFINDVMPLIRYRTGDRAVRGKECDCELSFPVISSIEGRKDDILVTPDGRRVGRLDPVFKGLPDGAFREVQIAQTSKHEIVIRFVPGPRFEARCLAKVTEELRKRLGAQITIETEEMSRLPRGANGKVRAVVREM